MMNIRPKAQSQPNWTPLKHANFLFFQSFLTVYSQNEIDSSSNLYRYRIDDLLLKEWFSRFFNGFWLTVEASHSISPLL